MEEHIMIENLQKTVEMLKSMVEQNLEVIHNNEATVRSILAHEEVSKTRSDKMKFYADENKKLLKLNTESINLQMNLIKFIKSFRSFGKEIIEVPQEIAEQIAPELNRDDYFNLTISNDLQFDEKHPFFEDEDFYNELMAYYMEREDYESCAAISASRHAMS